MCHGVDVPTDTITAWTDLPISRKRAVRHAIADMDAAGALTEAAATLRGRFTNCDVITEHIRRMESEAAELTDTAHDAITPDEYEAFLDRQGA